MGSVIFHFVLIGTALCDKSLHHNTLQAPSAPVAQYPQYPEYPDYGYAPSSPGEFSTDLDRQGLEAVLGAPVVITAFAAALFGGLLSPLISNGLSRMAEFEIEWPEFKQKVEQGTKKKKLSKNKTKSSSKARELDTDTDKFSWIKTLETVNNLVGKLRTKRSGGKFDKLLALGEETMNKMTEQANA